MLVVNRIDSITATASAASAVSASYTMQGGGTVGKSLFVFVAHTGSIAGDPVSAITYGSDSLSFIAAQQSVAASVTIEAWEVDQPVTQSGTITVGMSTTPQVALFGVEFNGLFAADPAAGSNGSTSPITQSYTDTVHGGGNAAQTVTVPVTNDLLVGIGCAYFGNATGTLVNASGTQDARYGNPFSFGPSTDRGVMSILYQQSTGGSDTIAWTEQNNRSWAELIVPLVGCAPRGMVIQRAPAVLKDYYAVGSRP